MKKLLPLFLLAIALVTIILLLRKSQGESHLAPAKVSDQDTEVKLAAAALAAAFEQDEAAANEAYLNKIVEVTGHIAHLNARENGTTIILATDSEQTQVRCRLDKMPGEEPPTFRSGQSIRLKCVCSGYVKDVEMVHCISLDH